MSKYGGWKAFGPRQNQVNLSKESGLGSEVSGVAGLLIVVRVRLSV